MKRLLKLTLKIVLGLLVFLLLYAIVIFFTSIVSVNENNEVTNKNIPIYILSNGVHTDIVLPLKNEIKDWSTDISYLDTKAKDSTRQSLAFGWGDKGFYLDTPTWADLKASTAAKAVTGLSSSAMHITFYGSLKEDENCKKFFISENQYQKMIHYIENSFLLDTSNKIQRIGTHSYGKHDIFYEAKGSYNLFYTCNTWANQALKAGNQKAALWTVLDKGIFWHYN
ncbi:TIGR02117 family protein [Flavobacterium sediminilitoris]|uniref:TIGR02117 family protein n=1 Tax=Flavobacterium sediminilitoris TaxID=2024526 RepID=A0ABY4HMA6_9FLAO|nr:MULTISPECIES: TIGR02117 family protein [Flavobacterium]UOX33801.1 TIGR02117 family protein [Flavobacterium sediminilitoris]